MLRVARRQEWPHAPEQLPIIVAFELTVMFLRGARGTFLH